MARSDHTWDWLGEPLAVDFANTVLRRGGAYEDLLGAADDVVAWARHERALDRGRLPRPVAAGAVRSRLEEIRAVRDDVFAVLGAAAASERPPAATVQRINERIRANPVVRVIDPASGAPAAELSGAADPVTELLARVVDAAVQLVGDPAAELALCDAPSCGQFFIPSRGNQRWCGPACGNRARVARHAHAGDPGR